MDDANAYDDLADMIEQGSDDNQNPHNQRDSSYNKPQSEIKMIGFKEESEPVSFHH